MHTVAERIDNRHVKFNCSKADSALIDLIAKRAVAFGVENAIDVDHETIAMDLSACHCNGCPLDLVKLLTAPDVHFGHDVFGIRRFMNRETGRIDAARFHPRCALPESKKPAKRAKR